MKEYEIKFKHTIEENYTARVKAESMEQALTLFDDDPFAGVEDEESESTQGLRIDILEAKEIK